MRSTPLAIAALLVVSSGCSQTPQAVAYPAPLNGSSQTFAVGGQYEPIALDRVDKVAIESAKLVLHGSSASVAVDPPAAADMAKPTRNWALTTEADAGSSRRLTFTHAESLDDFTIELPASEAELRYGVFSGRTEGEVMLLAWGTGSQSFWGHVTIVRRPSSP